MPVPSAPWELPVPKAGPEQIACRSPLAVQRIQPNFIFGASSEPSETMGIVVGGLGVLSSMSVSSSESAGSRYSALKMVKISYGVESSSTEANRWCSYSGSWNRYSSNVVAGSGQSGCSGSAGGAVRV
jgi:hypothetical protein